MEINYRLFISFSFIFSLLLFPQVRGQSWNSDVDEFLNDPNNISDFRNLEGLKKNDYEVIDQIRDQKEMVKRKLEYKEIPTAAPRVFTDTETYTAQLNQGAILKDVKTKKPVKVFREVIVKARQTYVGSPIVYIFDKNGEAKYTTRTSNAINIEHEVVLEPTVDQLKVYTDKSNYHSVDEDLHFTTYFGFNVESITTNYYATIFRGEKKSAQNYALEAKTYMLTKNSPYNFGFNLQYQYGYWQDPVIGTATWSGLFIGPSFMFTFWKKKESQWNTHINLLKSIYHKSQKFPETHSFSTVGTEIELEKEMMTSLGRYSFGVKYSWLTSSINNSSEYLENVANRGIIASFGAYINYNFDWSL